MATFSGTRCFMLGASILMTATVSTSAATSPATVPRPMAIPLLDSCNTIAPGAFVGVDNNCNVADAPDSVVVGGLNNAIQATVSDYSAIVGGSGNATWSGTGGFIGSGFSNAIGAFEVSSRDNASSIVGGGSNTVFSSYASILGGLGNIVGAGGTPSPPDSDYSLVAGGTKNNVSGIASAIVDGENNVSQGRQDFIGGGYANRITVTSNGGSNGAALAVINGGSYNAIAAATLGAGYFGVVGGGTQNILTGPEATIAGGYANSASGIGAAIPGGSKNIAAGYDSFAAGTHSDAANDGSFVFSDDAVGAKQLITAGTNEFLVRASGGVAFYSSPSLTAGVVLRAGSGSWASLSDRASKTDIVALDPASVLAKVASLPVSEWSYTAQGTGVRHLGPMAQDFRAAFGLGEDDKHISTVDEDGVALAAIKALQAESKAKDRQIAELRDAHLADEARFASLEKRIDALEIGSRPSAAQAGRETR
jgi:hypothetical protein